jgi:nickel-dependent lactate racemase
MRTAAADGTVVGHGSATASLSTADMASIVADALRQVPHGARVLAIISDRTRDDNTAALFPLVSRQLARLGASRFDALVAQGTHAPMGEADKRAKIGWGETDIPLLGEVFDHHWDQPHTLMTVGTLPASDVRSLTGGLIDQAVPVRLNARVADGSYDIVLVLGATVPHEVAGFAGGSKYFFPGVAGSELTHMTHWLGALATIERVIGRVETPTRHMIEAAADLLPVPVIALTSVVTRDANGLTTRALFAGDFRETFRRAAQISQQVHVKYTGRQYRRAVALLDPHYDELWVGGKASYKLGAIIEPGGELLIYAPHLTQISVTHGKLIERYGYAPLEHVREMVDNSDELQANLAVAAHLAHVAYASRQTADGRIEPRYRITLASGVPEEMTRRVKLGFLDHRQFDVAKYRSDPDTLVVENAGRDLYLVNPETSAA